VPASQLVQQSPFLRRQFDELDLLLGRAQVDSALFLVDLPDLLCLADQRGFFVNVSPAWEQVLGYSRDEMVGIAWLDFVHPNDVDITIEEAAAMKNRGAAGFLNRYRTKAGDYRWLCWRSMMWSQEGLTLAAVRDVTDVPQLRGALRGLAATRAQTRGRFNPTDSPRES
jgi:PAS domain S-box-containing protein